jgi:hypothetical protein
VQCRFIDSERYMAKSGAERIVVSTPIVGELDDRIVSFIAIPHKTSVKRPSGNIRRRNRRMPSLPS